MFDFRIYIPTYKRPRQVTWSLLPDSIRKKTWLVVHEDEVKHLESLGCQVLVCPVQGRLHRVRQWVLENTKADGVLLLDDDLRFFRRKNPDDWHLRNATDGDKVELFAYMERLLASGYVHLSITPRPGNRNVGYDHNEKSGQYVWTGKGLPYGFFGRTWMAFAFLPAAVRELGVSFRTELMSDFDFTLQLLRKGYAQPMIGEWAVGQNTGVNAKGGCSVYRNAERMAQAAKTLQQLHPGFVKAVKKTTRWETGLTERWDVQVDWQEAWRSAPMKHGNHADPKFRALVGPFRPHLRLFDTGSNLIICCGKDRIRYTEEAWRKALKSGKVVWTVKG